MARTQCFGPQNFEMSHYRPSGDVDRNPLAHYATAKMRSRILLVALIAACTAILSAPQNPEDAVAAGDAVFFGKGNCSSCHEINGRGGIVGPDLSAAGTRTPEALRAKILNPNAATGGRGGTAPLVVVAKRPD